MNSHLDMSFDVTKADLVVFKQYRCRPTSISAQSNERLCNSLSGKYSSQT